MDRRYMVLLIHGPYPLVQGFLAGYMIGKGFGGEIFYCEKEKIDVDFDGDESLTEKLVEWIGFRRYMATAVVIEESLFEPIGEAVRSAGKELNLEVEASRAIGSASFKIRFETYSIEAGREIKKLIDFHPNEVKLSDDFTMEEKREEKAAGVEGYAPEHDYELKGSGVIEGDVAAVIHYRSQALENPLIQCDPIKLALL